jgi:hypothetical protein
LSFSKIEKEVKAVATFMEAAYFNNSGAVQGVVILTQEVKITQHLKFRFSSLSLDFTAHIIGSSQRCYAEG